MPEDVLRLGVAPQLTDDVGAEEDGELGLQVLRVRDVLENALGEAPADHRRDLDEPARLGRQAVDPREQEALERGGEPGARVRRRDRPAVALSLPLDEGVQQLLEVERVALGAHDDLRQLRRVQLLALRPRAEELLGGIVVERPERGLRGAVEEVQQRARPQLPALRLRVDARRRDQEDRCGIRKLEQILGQCARGRIGPVHVLDSDHHWTLRRERAHPGGVGAAKLRGQLFGTEVAQAVVLVAVEPDAHEAREEREHLRHLRRRQEPELRPQLRTDRQVGLALLGADPLAQHLDEGRVGRFGAVREASALQPRDPAGGGAAQLGQQARLADAGVPGHQQHLPAAGDQLVQDRGQTLHLVGRGRSAG